MSRRHYGLVVKIFAFRYKGPGFESSHVHFHTGDPATCNTQSTPTHLNQQRLSSSISLTNHSPHAQQPRCLGGSYVEIPTRNIQMSRHHYGLVVKIFVSGYKGCRFESPHLHFHSIPTYLFFSRDGIKNGTGILLLYIDADPGNKL